MASPDPAESSTDPRDANGDPPDNTSDELSGSIRITFDKTTLLCDPCLEDRHNLPAEGYCVDCSHYLCVDCYKCHRRPVPCRHHKLMDKKRMPKTKPTPVYKDECTDKCEEHGDEIIKFYCEECKQFGCSVCVTLGHSSCNQRKQVGYIPKLSQYFFQSQEYTSFKASLNSLAEKAATVLSEASSNIEAVNSQADQALEEVRKLRKEIDSYFDELEKDIVDKVEKARIASRKKLEKTSKQCEAMSSDIGELQLDVTDKEKKDQKCRLFVDTKQALDKLKEYDNKMCELESENEVGVLEFIPSDLLSRLVKDKTLKLGVFIRLDKRITINTSEEKSYITGICILSNNKVALADHENYMIKAVNTESNSIVTSEVLEFVWGITRVSDSEVAVMQGGSMAIYYVTNQEIKLKKTIRISGVDNNTLLYTNNRFIVVTDTHPPTLRIVDMKGEVVKTFPTEVDGNALFEDPHYIAVNPNRTRIYVSDWDMQTVTCMTFDGEVRARYKPESGWSPRGVAVSGDGTVYVADIRNHTIHILSSDLQERCVINDSKYGISVPYGLAYCDRDHKLYVVISDGRRCYSNRGGTYHRCDPSEKCCSSESYPCCDADTLETPVIIGIVVGVVVFILFVVITAVCIYLMFRTSKRKRSVATHTTTTVNPSTACRLSKRRTTPRHTG